MKQTTAIDILSVGELLIDLISTGFAETFTAVKNFERFPGGSPANFANNMSRLGNQVGLIASVGKDDMGQLLIDSVTEAGVNSSQIARVKEPTTLILVTKTKDVANFEPYRGADCQISAEQFPDELLKKCAVFHTTCFALSQLPAQINILNAAVKAYRFGKQLSIDANYAQKIWPDQEQAQSVLSTYCQMGAIVKVSEVDWQRLYGTRLDEPALAAQHFLKMGAKIACVTLGEKGCYAASKEEYHFLPSRKVEVKDTTGAGDAFWSGFMTAWLDQHPILNCLKAGRRMAELKLSQVGSLTRPISRKEIYVDFTNY